MWEELSFFLIELHYNKNEDILHKIADFSETSYNYHESVYFVLCVFSDS